MIEGFQFTKNQRYSQPFFVYNFNGIAFPNDPAIRSFSDYCCKFGKNYVCDADLVKKYIFAAYKQNFTTCQTSHQELKRSSLTN
jgi:hypothetical protein